MRLVVFDVCDTLYAANTTVEFLRFLAGRDHPRLSALIDRWSNRNHPLFWIGALAHRLAGLDLARHRMLAGLRGIDRRTLAAEAEAFVSGPLGQIKNETVHSRLEAHRAQGDRILLVSNGLDPVIGAIAHSLDVEWLSSRLAFEGDCCLGHLSLDLTGCKAAALSKTTDDVVLPITVYTDNRTDRDLIDRAEHAVIIVPAGKRPTQWAGKEHEYLAL